MKSKLLWDLIQEKIHLGSPNPAGWRPVRCQVCNDHSARAGFMNDGTYTGFHDFNCGAKFKYEENSGELSKSAKSILGKFGITRQELDEVTGSAFFRKSEEKKITLEGLKGPTIKLFTPEIPLPEQTYALGSDIKPELQEPLIKYLESRKLDYLSLNAHFSTHPKYLGRVIIPCMRDGKIIFWQARTIVDGVKPRYLSPGVDRTAVLFGYEELWKHPERPLFVTEGIFDAASIDGVALLGSKLNDSKIEVLNRCRRKKIVVVDRDENGKALAELALQNKWQVTFAPAKDANKSVELYGKPYTIWSLIKNATVPGKLVTTDGISVQSQLQLQMELALTRRTRTY